VASGAVTSGTTLQLGGVDYQLSGTPAAGDNFTISPSRPQSAFSLLQNIAATLASASGNGATGQSAQITQQLNTDLTSLAQYQQSVTVAQAQNGATLQAVSNASTSDSTESTSVQNAVQTATAVNVPAAITSLDETETAIQAAMKAFGTAEGLSLFTYL